MRSAPARPPRPGWSERFRPGSPALTPPSRSSPDRRPLPCPPPLTEPEARRHRGAVPRHRSRFARRLLPLPFRVPRTALSVDPLPPPAGHRPGAFSDTRIAPFSAPRSAGSVSFPRSPFVFKGLPHFSLICDFRVHASCPARFAVGVTPAPAVTCALLALRFSPTPLARLGVSALYPLLARVRVRNPHFCAGLRAPRAPKTAQMAQPLAAQQLTPNRIGASRPYAIGAPRPYAIGASRPYGGGRRRRLLPCPGPPLRVSASYTSRAMWRRDRGLPAGFRRV